MNAARTTGILLALGLLAARPAAAQDSLKLAIVDVQRVMEATPEWTKAVGILKREWEKKSAELEAKQNELKSAKEKLEGKRQLVGDAKALAREEEALIEKLKEFRRDTMVSQQMFQQREAFVKEQMLSRIEQVVYKIAADGDYTFIFETGNAESPNVLFANKKTDVTEAVIGDYSKAFKGKALETNPPKGAFPPPGAMPTP